MEPTLNNRGMSVPSMDTFQPNQMMDLMERMFDTKGGAAGGLPMSLAPQHRGFGEIHIGEDLKKFELSFDLGGNCKPENVDINVKLLDNVAIQVEAPHETGPMDSGEYRNHYFVKTISLPEEIDVQALTEHGVLKGSLSWLDSCSSTETELGQNGLVVD